MEQKFISEKTQLLDKNGDLAVSGYCEKNRFIYDKSMIKSSALRIKEWDCYQISDDKYTVRIIAADISVGGSVSFSLLNRKTGEKLEKNSLSLLTFGKTNLENDVSRPHFFRCNKNDFDLKILVTPKFHYITCLFKLGSDEYKAYFELSLFSDHDSLTFAVPFDKKKHFHLEQNINSMKASGHVTKNGETLLEFKDGSAFGILDWGRGVWPFSSHRYRGNGHTYLADGRLFGFEIGWGFGDMTAATGNMIFIDGKGHKIEEVYVKKDENDYMKPWHFSSNDGRFEFTMTPTHDNYSSSRIFGLVGNKSYQIFGKWEGKAVLDDGEVIKVSDMTAFCEFSDNRW